MVDTANITVVVLASEPLEAVNVSGYEPGEIEFDVNTFNVTAPVPIMLGGTKLALEPAGKPLTPNVTAPANPFVAVTVRLKLVLPPAKTD